MLRSAFDLQQPFIFIPPTNRFLQQIAFLQTEIMQIFATSFSSLPRKTYCNSHLSFSSLQRTTYCISCISSNSLLATTNSLLQQLSSFFSLSQTTYCNINYFSFPLPPWQLIAIVTFHFQQLYCTFYLSSSSLSTNSLFQQVASIFLPPTNSILQHQLFLFTPITNSSLQRLPFIFLPPPDSNINYFSSTLTRTAHCDF